MEEVDVLVSVLVTVTVLVEGGLVDVDLVLDLVDEEVSVTVTYVVMVERELEGVTVMVSVTTIWGLGFC